MRMPEARIVEEYEDNKPTDVEAEEPSEFHEIDRPWNPESIRVASKSFSVRQIMDSIDDQSLDLAPDFQRLRVWTAVQKCQLIESMLLQIPLPAFYFAEDVDGVLRVVDGVQRLSTIHDFIRGERDGKEGFRLEGLEYLGKALHGLRFSQLPPVWKRRLDTTQIIANVIAPTTPSEVMYDIFRRINTGGTPLSAQEIRHCMTKQRSRDFLKKLAGLPEFKQATEGRLENHKRMVDREVVLRFVSFWHFGPEAYASEATSLDAFLLMASKAIDDPRQIPDEMLARIESAFTQGLSNAIAVFGDHAFRKWPHGFEDKRKPFNRALFEVWTVELAKIPPQDARSAAEKIVSSTRQAYTYDVAYLASVSTATGDPRNVRKRFHVTQGIIKEALR